jgi:hypothetical protein
MPGSQADAGYAALLCTVAAASQAHPHVTGRPEVLLHGFEVSPELLQIPHSANLHKARE